MIRVGIPSNVTLNVVPPDFGSGKIWEAKPNPFNHYVARGGECGLFDAVLIDGRARIDCAVAVAKSGVLKPGGWLFFHDWPYRRRYTARSDELAPFYELKEVIDHTRRGMAVFQRHGW